MLNKEMVNFSHRVNVVSEGSPSRIRRVLLMSFGMTTRRRSSMRLTIPVAFISESPCLLVLDYDGLRALSLASLTVYCLLHVRFCIMAYLVIRLVPVYKILH